MSHNWCWDEIQFETQNILNFDLNFDPVVAD